LSRAIKNLDLSLSLVQNAKPSLKNWLFREIGVEYTPSGKMLITMNGSVNERTQIQKIVRPIINAYLEELRHQQGIFAQEAKGAQNPLFPTLEEQRAADLAYKLLGVELEKLSPEELERVKAKGYQGGLRAIDEGGLRVGGRPLNNGDLLVGLHVWPTESFEDVTEILSRDDLDQLSPMKFYAIRRQPKPQYTQGGTMIPEGVDPIENVIVSGRIQVDLDVWREMRNQARGAELKQLASLKKQLQEELVEKERLRDEGTIEERAMRNGEIAMLDAEIAQLREILRSMEKQLAIWGSQASSSGQPALPSALQDGQLVESQNLYVPANQNTHQSLASRRAAKQYEFAQKRYENALESNRQVRGNISQSEIEELKLAAELAKIEWAKLAAQQGVSAEDESQDLYMPVDPNAKVNLSGSRLVTYDGKTFDQWRQMWQSELKTEKRTECIKALAAFARVGMGPDAAEAVLDVAGEYNFGDSNSGPVLELKNAIHEVLTSGDGIPAEHWLPLFVDRLKKDPNKWGPMSSWVLRDMRSKNPEVLKLLISIAGDQKLKSSLRRIAVESIVGQLDSGNKDAENIVRDALTSGDPMQALSALHQLSYTRLDQFPEQIDLLFSADKSIRRQAHNWVDRLADEPHADWAIDKLIEVSHDPKRGEDRGVALLALAEIAKSGEGRANTKSRIRVWEQIIASLQTGDGELIPYALAAAAHLQGSDFGYIVRELGEKIDDGRRKQIEETFDKAEDVGAEYHGD
jgi:hypothetical protein